MIYYYLFIVIFSLSFSCRRLSGSLASLAVRCWAERLVSGWPVGLLACWVIHKARCLTWQCSRQGGADRVAGVSLRGLVRRSFTALVHQGLYEAHAGVSPCAAVSGGFGTWQLQFLREWVTVHGGHCPRRTPAEGAGG